MNTYNPILESKAFKNDLFMRIPIPKGEEAIVLSVKGSNLEPAVIDKSGGPSIKTMKKYDWQTNIDTSKHKIDLEFRPNSSNHVNNFIIQAKFTAQVTNPVLVYQEQIQDVTEYIKHTMEDEIEDTAREFDIDKAPDLRHKLKENYKTLSIKGLEVKLDHLSVVRDMETRRVIENRENENVLQQETIGDKGKQELSQQDLDAIMATAAERGGQSIQLNDCLFYGLNFQGDFSNVNFSDSKFAANCRLEHATFSNANFERSELDIDVKDTVFEHVNFRDAKIRSSRFQSVQFHDVDFSKTRFQRVSFYDSEIKNANYMDAEMDRVQFRRTVARGKQEHIDTICMTMKGATKGESEMHKQKILDTLHKDLSPELKEKLRRMEREGQKIMTKNGNICLTRPPKFTENLTKEEVGELTEYVEAHPDLKTTAVKVPILGIEPGV